MINADWHKKHKMPKNATIEEKVEWHEGHAKHCKCRDSLAHLKKLKAKLNK